METTTQIEKQEYEFRFLEKYTVYYETPIMVTAESIEDAKRIVLECMERAIELGISDKLGYLERQDGMESDCDRGDYLYGSVENCSDDPGGIEIRCDEIGLSSDLVYSSK